MVSQKCLRCLSLTLQTFLAPYSHVVDDSDENVPNQPLEERQSEHSHADGTDPEIACDAAEASKTKDGPEVEETQNFGFVFDEKALETGEHSKVLRVAGLVIFWMWKKIAHHEAGSLA